LFIAIATIGMKFLKYQLKIVPVINFSIVWGSQYHIWLRHYATSRKVAGRIPYEVIGFLNCPNPSSRTMVLGSAQPLAEMSAMNLPECEGRLARKADNLTAICEPIVRKYGSLDV
jgi:hypothetical protein